MTRAVCPGSYDPFTLGHLDIIRRTRTIFDEVIVAVGANPQKNYLFSPEERAEHIRQAVADIPGVRVEIVSGLMAQFCVESGANSIVKGLRGAADYSGEQAMALLNRHLSGIETMFVMGDPALSHIASSLVKDVAKHGGKISDMVPEHVGRALIKEIR